MYFFAKEYMSPITRLADPDGHAVMITHLQRLGMRPFC